MKDDEKYEEINSLTYNNDNIENEENEFEDDKLLVNQSYEMPSDEDKFIDTSDDKIIDKSKLTHWDVIKAVAKQNNIEIRNPRSGCKHCYGRGYIGLDFKTKCPVPCRCIYLPNNEIINKQPVLSKKDYKKIKKLIKIEKEIIKKQKIEEELKFKKIEGNKNG